MPSTYGVGRTAAYDIKTVFHGFNRAVTIRTERGGYLYNNVAERISARRATHGFIAKWIPALENVTERSECFFLWSVTERISARRGESHGLSRSGYPPLQNVTERCGAVWSNCSVKNRFADIFSLRAYLSLKNGLLYTNTRALLGCYAVCAGATFRST